MSKEFVVSAAGFAYLHTHCTGVGEVAYGAVRPGSNGRIVLEPRVHMDLRESAVARPDRRRDFHFEREMYIVPWGVETFVVPGSLMQEFCAMATADGWNKMRYADYPRLLRSTDDSGMGGLDLTGLPTVPAEFQRYLPH